MLRLSDWPAENRRPIQFFCVMFRTRGAEMKRLSLVVKQGYCWTTKQRQLDFSDAIDMFPILPSTSPGNDMSEALVLSTQKSGLRIFGEVLDRVERYLGEVYRNMCRTTEPTCCVQVMCDFLEELELFGSTANKSCCWGLVIWVDCAASQRSNWETVWVCWRCCGKFNETAARWSKLFIISHARFRCIWSLTCAQSGVCIHGIKVLVLLTYTRAVKV